MASVDKVTLINTTGSTATVTGSKVETPIRGMDPIAVITTVNQNAATTVTGKIQHSSDGVNWVDLVSLTAINATSGYQVAVPTTIGLLQFVRGVATLSGSTKLADILLELWVDPRRH